MCLYIGKKDGFLVTSTNKLVKSKYTKVGRVIEKLHIRGYCSSILSFTLGSYAKATYSTTNN